ncbi:hypothetical protein BDN70DRAFT_994473 [Pholiota conissans]|uniref:Uncharacterized protein n=1 Tax=Pholiota conissans TaxID=109636 RepID=A0A9P5Z1J8_9AGAR|nr:hypothetical protein BDN70DRAFT_994473 [Pholiota conissans]
MSFLVDLYFSFLDFIGMVSHSVNEDIKLEDCHKLPCGGKEYPEEPGLAFLYYERSMRSHLSIYGLSHVNAFTVTKIRLYRERYYGFSGPSHAYLCAEARYQYGGLDETIYVGFERFCKPMNTNFEPPKHCAIMDIPNMKWAGRPPYDVLVRMNEPRRLWISTLCSTLTFTDPMPFYRLVILAQMVGFSHLADLDRDGKSNTYLFAGMVFEVLRMTMPVEVINAKGAGGAWYLDIIHYDEAICADIERAEAWHAEDWEAVTREIQINLDGAKDKLADAVELGDLRTADELGHQSEELRAEMERLKTVKIKRLANDNAQLRAELAKLYDERG